MIKFLILKQGQLYLQHWKSHLGAYIYMLFLLMYAFAAGATYHIYPRLQKEILGGVCLSLILIPLIVKFFPVIALKKASIAPQYPLGKFEKAVIDLVAFCFCSVLNIALLLFIVVFYLAAGLHSLGLAWGLLLYWLTGFLLAENVINALSWQKYLYLGINTAVFTGLLFIKNLDNISAGLLNLLLLGGVVVLISIYLILYVPGEGHFKKENARSWLNYIGGRHISLKMLINNKTFLVVMFIGLLAKNSLTGVLLFSSKTKEVGEVLDKVPMIIIFLSPVVLFTYIYNNLWGYFRNLQLNLLLLSGDLRPGLKSYFSLLLPLLVFDFLLQFTILILLHCFELKLLFFYVGLMFYCIPLGIISSYTKGFVIESALNFSKLRGNSSTIYAIALLGPVIVIGLLYHYTIYFYASLIVLSLVSFCLCYYVLHGMCQHLMSKSKATVFK